jgi:hypothetical protein
MVTVSERVGRAVTVFKGVVDYSNDQGTGVYIYSISGIDHVRVTNIGQDCWSTE